LLSPPKSLPYRKFSLQKYDIFSPYARNYRKFLPREVTGPQRE
jgi:hypothetical protein